MMRMSLFGATLASTFVLAACQNPLTPAATAPQQVAATSNAAAPAPAAAAPAPATAAAPAVAATPASVVSGPTATVAADATNQNFTLNNRSGETITHAFVSRVSDNQWGADVLGSQVVPAGQSATITFPRGEAECNWDVRVTVNNDKNHEMRNLNLCQTTEVNYD